MDSIRHLQYQYIVSHASVACSLSDSSSALSAAHTLNFKESLEERGYNMHERQCYEYCPDCLTIMIPGINMKMRCIYTKSKKSKGANKKNEWKARSRFLRYTCLCCQKQTDFELLKPSKNPCPRESTAEKTEGFVAKWTPPSRIEKNSSQTAKERAKKRKKNNLSNLISGKKKQEEETTKGSGLLSLEAFMKQ